MNDGPSWTMSLLMWSVQSFCRCRWAPALMSYSFFILFSFPPMMIIIAVQSGHSHDDPSHVLTITTPDDDLPESLCLLLFLLMMQGLMLSLPFCRDGLEPQMSTTISLLMAYDGERRRLIIAS